MYLVVDVLVCIVRVKETGVDMKEKYEKEVRKKT